MMKARTEDKEQRVKNMFGRFYEKVDSLECWRAVSSPARVAMSARRTKRSSSLSRGALDCEKSPAHWRLATASPIFSPATEFNFSSSSSSVGKVVLLFSRIQALTHFLPSTALGDLIGPSAAPFSSSSAHLLLPVSFDLKEADSCGRTRGDPQTLETVIYFCIILLRSFKRTSCLIQLHCQLRGLQMSEQSMEGVVEGRGMLPFCGNTMNLNTSPVGICKALDLDGNVTPNQTTQKKRKRAIDRNFNGDYKQSLIKECQNELDGLFEFYKEVSSYKLHLEEGEFPSMNSAVACMLEESRLSFSALVDEIYNKMKAKDGSPGVTLASVRSAVLFVGQRMMYGIVNEDVDVLEDESEKCLWCWEVMVFKMLFLFVL
ncbi:Chromatin assembly factor 1 subunit FSM [Platanthera guangdongensis]|uniref:Chromatin assembly factor 1 subunit FSM n=1 Tax=Platanthera guangdongensis TaxID=2320717 RepID=A0ABR2MKK3_9ASPA